MNILFNKIYNSKRLLLISVFFVSILFSSIFLIFLGKVGPLQHETPGTDYLSFYQPVANNILHGEGITIGGELGLRYPPGYPIVLAVIFGLAEFLSVNELNLVVIFNVIVAAGSVCLLFLIAESVFNKKIALISSLLWLSYPFSLWFLKNPNTEVPFIFLLYLGIWLYLLAIKKNHFWLIFFSGAVLGFASLIRPIGLLFPILLILFAFFLFKGNSKKLCFLLALVLLAGNLVTILPWEIHVFSQTGKIVPLSSSGPTAIIDGLTFAVRPGTGDDQVMVSEDVLKLMKRADNEDLSTGAKIFNFIAKELTSNPVSFVKLISWKLARSWYATSQMWWEGKILLVQLFYLLFVLVGITFSFRNYKDKIKEVVFFLTIILFFWGMTFLALSILRYMVPVMGIVIIFSAIAISALIKKICCLSR